MLSGKIWEQINQFTDQKSKDLHGYTARQIDTKVQIYERKSSMHQKVKRSKGTRSMHKMQELTTDKHFEM